MIKWIARKPEVEKRAYLKYGLYPMRSRVCMCPRCFRTLNAGPNYQPKYCDQCGQRLTFEGIEWEKDEEFEQAAERGEANESVENRMV